MNPIKINFKMSKMSAYYQRKDKLHYYEWTCKIKLINLIKHKGYKIQTLSTKGYTFCGRPWPAAYINFNQNIHQNQVLTKPLCRAQAIVYSLPNNEWGTKYHGLTYSAKLTVREICRATYSARQARLRI